MQNEELRRVFNISEHPSQRYNGCMLPAYIEKTPNKGKRISPKKKNIATEMVTARSKNLIKRKSKNSANTGNTIINGIGNANNFSKQNELLPFIEKYKSETNNFNNSRKHEVNSAESVNNFLTKLNDDSDPNFNRVRLANVSKFNNINRVQFPNASSNATYSKIQYISNAAEYDAKTNNNKKFDSFSLTGKTKKLEPFRKKNSEYLSYLSDPSYKLIQNNTQCDKFSGKHDLYVIVNRKLVNQDTQKKVLEITNEKKCENKLFLRAKRKKQKLSKWQMDSGTRHEALQRIRNSIEMHENLQNDLFPLNVGETGFEKSDSDSSEEYKNSFQNNWFQSIPQTEFEDLKRSSKLEQLYNEMRRQLCQIKKNKYELPILTRTFIKSMVDAARTKPTEAMQYILEDKKQQRISVEPLILSKKKCSVEGCKNVALPCMPTCVHHILLCDKQTLFEQCRVRDSNNFQCDKPVLNVKYHYPVCSLHSTFDFVLPNFSRENIKYDEIRQKHISTACPDVYKTNFDFINTNASVISDPSVSSKLEMKKKSNINSAKNNVNICSILVSKKKEKNKKITEKKDNKPVKNDQIKPKSIIMKTKETIKEEQVSTTAAEVNQSLLQDWVNLSSSQLVDTKNLDNSLQNDFVNGFDINTSSIQSQIQDIINSESTLSTDMLMGSHELPNYIQVEEMIEEVEITDETLDSSELNNQELVRCEDLNAVLKQLPPEAFSELFSDKSDTHWNETQALERVIEEMDVRKCSLIDPSLLLDDIEPTYSNYSNNYGTASLTQENVETKFNDVTGNNNQSQS